MATTSSIAATWPELRARQYNIVCLFSAQAGILTLSAIPRACFHSQYFIQVLQSLAQDVLTVKWLRPFLNKERALLHVHPSVRTQGRQNHVHRALHPAMQRTNQTFASQVTPQHYQTWPRTLRKDSLLSRPNTIDPTLRKDSLLPHPSTIEPAPKP